MVVGASGLLRGVPGYFPPENSSLSQSPLVEQRVREWDWNSQNGVRAYYGSSEVGHSSQHPSSNSFQWCRGQLSYSARNGVRRPVDSWQQPSDGAHTIHMSDDERSLGTKYPQFQGMIKRGGMGGTIYSQHLDGARSSQLVGSLLEPSMPTVAALPMTQMILARGGWVANDDMCEPGTANPGTGSGNVNHKSSGSSWPPMVEQQEQSLESSAGILGPKDEFLLGGGRSDKSIVYNRGDKGPKDGDVRPAQAKQKRSHARERKPCLVNGCMGNAIYTSCAINFAGDSTGVCKGHKEAGMVKISRRKCKVEGCLSYPIFGHDEDKLAIRCGKHKEPGMVDVKNRRCTWEGCNVRPRYGFEGMPTVVCGGHKVAGMITTVNGKVLVAKEDGEGRVKAGGDSPKSEADVSKRADKKHPSRAAAKSTQRPIFCSTHKEEDMVGLKNRPCMYPGCDIRPHYGREGQRAEYCANHKEDNMVHVKVAARNRQLNALREKQPAGENSGEGDKMGREREFKRTKKGDANVEATATVEVNAAPSAKKDSPPRVTKERLSFAKVKRKTGRSDYGSSSLKDQQNTKLDWDRNSEDEREGKDQTEDSSQNDWDVEETGMSTVAAASQPCIRPGKRNIMPSRKALAAAGVDEPSGLQRMTKDMKIREKERIAATANQQKTNNKQIQLMGESGGCVMGVMDVMGRETKGDVALCEDVRVDEVRIRGDKKGVSEKRLKVFAAAREAKRLKIATKSSRLAGMVVERTKRTPELGGLSDPSGPNIFEVEKVGPGQGWEEEGDWVKEEEWLGNNEWVEEEEEEEEEEEGTCCEFPECQGKALFGLRGGGARYW